MKPLFEKIVAPGQSFLCKERIDRSFGFNWHFHPEYELTYIVQSQGQRFVGDSIEPYGGGDLILLGEDLPHTWASDPAAPGKAAKAGKHYAIYAQWPVAFLGEDFFEKPELLVVARLLERSSQGLRFTGAALKEVAPRMKKMFEASGFERLMCFLDILGILAHARDVKPLASKGYLPNLRHVDERRIDAVCRWINEQYTRPIGQPEAASRAHLSVSAFSRFFKKSMGKSFTAYVNELRVGLACRMLIESDKNVAEIAYTSGFENLSNFNRRFRALKKQSPGEYRRQFAQTG
ncbi:MAG: AraC family transcriptional regulator [Planctomycetota bacterium]|nr:AraC family transcriptional regulator [Planctomycetota bacterium]